MEFLARSSAGDGPLVAFGGSDGVVRVLSMITWKVSLVYGNVYHLMTFFSKGITLLVANPNVKMIEADSVHQGKKWITPIILLLLLVGCVAEMPIYPLPGREHDKHKKPLQISVHLTSRIEVQMDRFLKKLPLPAYMVFVLKLHTILTLGVSSIQVIDELMLKILSML